MDEEAVREALIELPERLGLRRVSDPQVFSPSEGALVIAGVVLIAESHVSIHCFVDHSAIHVDVFSCKDVDFSTARDYVTRYFGAQSLRDRVLDRGADASARDDHTVRVTSHRIRK